MAYAAPLHSRDVDIFQSSIEFSHQQFFPSKGKQEFRQTVTNRGTCPFSDVQILGMSARRSESFFMTVSCATCAVVSSPSAPLSPASSLFGLSKTAEANLHQNKICSRSLHSSSLLH